MAKAKANVAFPIAYAHTVTENSPLRYNLPSTELCTAVFEVEVEALWAKRSRDWNKPRQRPLPHKNTTIHLRGVVEKFV